MKQYGLIGYPLTHSFSPQYFSEKWARENILSCTYQLFPLVNISELPNLCQQNPALCGLNVTIPHKQSIIPLLHQISTEAQAINAVNCIAIEKGKMIGYNTDIYGFEQSLVPLLLPYHQHAFILGNGGASKAVQYVLKKLGISYQIVSRQIQNKQQINYSDFQSYQMPPSGIIINTTPLGMYPHTNDCPPIPYEALNAQYICYDLVYNPSNTIFLQKAAQQGAICQNGLEMLYKQADYAWEIWQNYQE